MHVCWAGGAQGRHEEAASWLQKAFVVSAASMFYDAFSSMKRRLCGEISVSEALPTGFPKAAADSRESRSRAVAGVAVSPAPALVAAAAAGAAAVVVAVVAGAAVAAAVAAVAAVAVAEA